MWLRRLLIAIGIVVALFAISISTLLTLELSRFNGLVEEQVSGITGRKFVIGGQFQPEIGATLTLVAQDIRLANADWGTC